MRQPVLFLACVLALTACQGETSSSTSNAPTKVVSVASEVPSEMLARAPFQIATDATNSPNEYVDPDTGAIRGWDVDLGIAMCKVMGVVCTFNNVTFDDIIPQLRASTPSEIAGGDKPRYVMSISSWIPSAAKEANGIDFISYFQAGESWMVKADGPSISTAVDMCGQTVVVVSGTAEESDAWGFMGQSIGGGSIPGDTDNCKAAGKQPITVMNVSALTDLSAALSTGKANFGWLDQPIADYQVKTSGGKMKLAGKPCSVTPYGIAVVTGSKLEPAITDAIKYLIDHQYYKAILDRWGVADGSITSANVTLNDNNAIGPTCVPAY